MKLSMLACLFSLQAYGGEPVKIGVLSYRPKPQTLDMQPLSAILKQAIPEHDFVVAAFTCPELDQAIVSHQLDDV